ncbi:hypothetical protein [Roseovarius sp. C03]|uniref:hypothetical protein n=1 Tax=Roseovarius sp. C03 TaxID=3449222 RepID=UPI003EDC038D
MIDRRPVPGNFTEHLEEDCGLSGAPQAPSPTLLDTPPERKTGVLGPDGEPVSRDVPRRRLGFILPHQVNTKEEGR